MSAFLGKIHYWLYNKIQLHENLLEQILEIAKNKNFDVETLKEESIKIYGDRVLGELQDVIDHVNIHGWLKSRIDSVEGRLAYDVTKLINSQVVKIEEMEQIFKNSGASMMNGLEKSNYSLEDYYNLIFDYMIDGMPCDMVNEVVKSDEKELVWERRICLHKVFFEKAGGDVEIYYRLRDAWIKGFLAASGEALDYQRTEDGTNTIRRN